MLSVAIAVAAHAHPARLRATIAAIARNTTPPYELFVVPDGADKETAAAFANLEGMRVLPDVGAVGNASCLNRAVQSTDADVIVLLESGALVGPRWLDHLVAALESSDRAGLAGPSTNRCWNEQGAFGSG